MPQKGPPPPLYSFVSILLVIFIHSSSLFVHTFAQQYRRELGYLDFYLGIKPANEQGEIGVQEHSIDKYVETSSKLACDFRGDCLWTNAPSDGLLDTNDFYLFQKTDKKSFPIQVGPGNSHPAPGTHFAFAGNLTSEPQSAVLLSAPIACQSSLGILSFEYWLYNSARLEVLLLKVNPIRGHLTVVERPPTDCHFLRPSGLCRVEIRRQQQPFRLAIRAFKLHDPAVGAFVMVGRIRYEAELCGFHDRPPIFGAIPTARWLRQRRPIGRASDLNCGREEGRNERFQDCLWADFARTASGGHTAHWAVGENTQQVWDQIVRTPSRPLGQFYFQFIDPIADFPLPQLRSVLVPCTQSPSALTFKYWLSPGVQAQVCTLGTDNVALSCVYLNEGDMPGPLTIDVDTADHQPFRFAFNVLRVDRGANGGGAVIALDEIGFSGWLCHESAPTTAPPPVPSLSALFQLRPLPTAGSVDASHAFPDSLDCDFERGDLCPHWMHSVAGGGNEAEEGEETADEGPEDAPGSQRFRLGVVPRRHLPFPVDGPFRGVHSAVALLDPRAQEEQFAILTSRPISCADKGRLSITYFASPGAQLSVCANEQCVSARRRRPPSGAQQMPNEMSVSLNSARPFRIRIVAERNATTTNLPIGPADPHEPFVLIKRIATKNGAGFCRLETPAELACMALNCVFAEDGLCKYKTMFLAVGDVPFVHKTGQGIVAQFAKGMRRAVLRSPAFRLPSGAQQLEMRLEASLSTFGARLYICPDEQQQQRVAQLARLLTGGVPEMGGEDVLRELGQCELLLGPKVEHAQMESLVVQLDPELRHFSLVAVHDKFDQFGEAEIVLGRLELSDSSGQPIC